MHRDSLRSLMRPLSFSTLSTGNDSQVRDGRVDTWMKHVCFDFESCLESCRLTVRLLLHILGR